MASTADRDTVQEGTSTQDVQAFAAKTGTYYAGTMVSVYNTTEAGRVAGTAVSGSTTAARVVGVVQEQTVISTQGNPLLLKQGDFWFNNSSGADELTIADINKMVYAVDNDTVSKTHGGDTRHFAGLLIGINSGSANVPAKGVRVRIGAGPLSGSI